ncbi:CRISPR-associated ring nuclease Csm6 [Desulfatirhabdium butyrativorans]|uniref:CRISPR-associated ring nuclease Csm6 n=1 Tax=Desulfatirhabdium butyrativorans TaxID=340467 RepID=UPI00041B4F32|nr:CRISPR-associated ring nuclease Csm6 [Desulfatirhabdium butyrativorans]
MKGILLAVSGLSPQVITETLYALHQSDRSVDAIHIITTGIGKERIFGTLMAGATGIFYQYLRDYQIDPASIDFGDHTIHVLHRENGSEIRDIETQEDNEALLAECLKWAHHFTRDPDTAVYFSIAGGRKTMSACLTLAAQFYARSWDRLYHVLVPPIFESSPEFYYPPPQSRFVVLQDQQGRQLKMDSTYGKVTLVPLPFISIRDQLTGNVLDRPLDPGTLMSSLVQDESPRLHVNPMEKKIIYNRVEVDFQPAWMALYLFFIQHKKSCSCNKTCDPSCTDCFLDMQEIIEQTDLIQDLYRRIGTNRSILNYQEGIGNLNKESFNMHKSRINKAIRKGFGTANAEKIHIDSDGKRPNTRYGIRFSKERIELS